LVLLLRFVDLLSNKNGLRAEEKWGWKGERKKDVGMVLYTPSLQLCQQQNCQVLLFIITHKTTENTANGKNCEPVLN